MSPPRASDSIWSSRVHVAANAATPSPRPENVPIISWLALRGDAAPAGPASAPATRWSKRRQPPVFACAWHVSGLPFPALAAMTFCAAADRLDWHRSRHPATARPADIAALVVWPAGQPVRDVRALAGCRDRCCGRLSALWSVYWLFKLVTGREGMGYGDFKLLRALGAWFGWQALPADAAGCHPWSGCNRASPSCWCRRRDDRRRSRSARTSRSPASSRCSLVRCGNVLIAPVRCVSGLFVASVPVCRRASRPWRNVCPRTGVVDGPSHHLTATGGGCASAIADAFPGVDAMVSFDRQALRERVFAQPRRRAFDSALRCGRQPTDAMRSTYAARARTDAIPHGATGAV